MEGRQTRRKRGKIKEGRLRKIPDGEEVWDCKGDS